VVELPSPGPVERRLIAASKRRTLVAALIDPEDFSPAKAAETAKTAIECGVSLILVGGSTLSDQNKLDSVVRAIKRQVTSSRDAVTPVVLFPGNVTGVSKYADAILFSSLLNSTNPYYIVGAQAIGSMAVYKAGIESIPMGYLVFGNSTAASFIGQANGIPTSKPNLALIYALAARYLGMRTLYLEAGSGSGEPVPAETIKLVRKFYDGLLIVGGGITAAETASKAASSGADILVVGNLLQTEAYEGILRQITGAVKNHA